MNRPLCFVLMPFGRKPDATGAMVDFDAIYHEYIVPAIAAADLDPVRADEDMTGGIIHKAMYERLILCEYAIADLTTATANVFYELGIRHAVRPSSTVLIYADRGRLPLDVTPLPAIPYPLTSAGTVANAKTHHKKLAETLRATRANPTDSPIFQLVEEFPDLGRLKTDVFRERVRYSTQIKVQLGEARQQGVEAPQSSTANFGSDR